MQTTVMEGKSTLMHAALFLGLFLSVNASLGTMPTGTEISTEPTGETTPNTTTPTSTTTSTTTTMSTTGNNSTTQTATEAPTTPTKQPLPTLDDYEYLFQENDTDFKKSLDICRTWGGDLVSIHSTRENDFIKENVTVNYDGSAWIGLQRLQSSYNWTDGTPFDFQNCLPETDNSSDEECYGFQKDGTWPNVSCDSTLPAYICRRPTGSMPTTTSPHSGGEDDGGLSQGAVIAVAAALVLLVIALSLGLVMCFIKKKRKPKTDAFTLLDNDQSSHHPLNPAGLSHTELILIICAVVLVGVTFSLGAVWFIYKRKSRRRDIGAFSLLEGETAADFRVDDDGYIDN